MEIKPNTRRGAPPEAHDPTLPVGYYRDTREQAELAILPFVGAAVVGIAWLVWKAVTA